MTEASTIDLTSIPSLLSKKIVNLKTSTYSQKEILYNISSARYDKFRDESESLFEYWLEESNKQLLDDVDNFVGESLAVRRSDYFTNRPESINVATVVLGIHNSDHIPTIDMIEKRISTRRNKMRIIRLQSHLDKKANLIDTFKGVRSQADILVIVERFGTSDTQWLGALILLLHKSLESKQATTVMVMICMSESLNMTLTFPPELTNKVGKLVQLVKDPREIIQDLPIQLLENNKGGCIFGPELFNVIDLDFVERNASLANLKFLYQYTYLEYLMRPASLLASGKKSLTKLAKSMLITELFRKIPSVKRTSAKSGDIVNFCLAACQKIDLHHEFIFNQLNYYFILLKDETRTNFPCHLQDIYAELAKHDDLGQSSKMYDAIEKLRKIPPSRVMSRIEKSVEQYRELSVTVEDGQDVYTHLCTFKSKLELEANKIDVISNLAEKLHSHLSGLKSLQSFPLHEAEYFNDRLLVKSRILPAIRHHAYSDFRNESSVFGVLYSMIDGSTETKRLADLYGDFEDKLDLDDGGLIKAIFLDLIKCMRQQGLIKFVKNDQIKRCVWL